MSCDRRPFDSHKEANAEAKAQSRPGHRPKAYQCTFCDKWHLTGGNKKKKKGSVMFEPETRFHEPRKFKK